jgi:hypothetical protein
MKINSKTGVILLLIAAAIAALTAAAHMSCLLLGPTCFEAQMAPPDIVNSAREGTLYAPIATTVVSGLFLICALYALSAAGKIGKLPLLKLGIYTIAFVCILRGFAIVPISTLFPNTPIGPRDWIAGAVWAFTGMCFLMGYRALHRR